MGHDAIDELERLLREEREAIRKLDGARVLSYSERKEAIVNAVRQSRSDMSAEDLKRLRALAPALRHNSVLLAHARDILRDALRVARADLGATSPVQTRRLVDGCVDVRAAAPRILSVRG